MKINGRIFVKFKIHQLGGWNSLMNWVEDKLNLRILGILNNQQINRNHLLKNLHYKVVSLYQAYFQISKIILIKKNNKIGIN